MKRTTRIHTAVYVQILVLLMIQINAVGPQVARLYPALAVGDVGECRCTVNCRCSHESRERGICCCKQAKKHKLKSHCAASPNRKQETALRTCPCGSASHAFFVAPEGQPFLAVARDTARIDVTPGMPVHPSEPPLYHDRRPDPPDPPPRLS
jgi:hypothetical protein